MWALYQPTESEGLRLKEAIGINSSLSCLTRVIDALVGNSSNNVSSNSNNTVHQSILPPYRESKLTWLLSDSLGGNSLTFMLVCVSPHPNNADETLHSLKYGAKARRIVHQVKVNENTAASQLLQLEDHVETLRQQLAQLDGDGLSAEEREQLEREIQDAESSALEKRYEIEGQAKRLARLEYAKSLLQERSASFSDTTKSLDAVQSRRVEDARSSARDATHRNMQRLGNSNSLAKELAHVKQLRQQNESQTRIIETRISTVDSALKSSDFKMAELSASVHELSVESQKLKRDLTRVRLLRFEHILRAKARCARMRVQHRKDMAAAETTHRHRMAQMKAAMTAELTECSSDGSVATIERQASAVEAENERLQAEIDEVRRMTEMKTFDDDRDIARLQATVKALTASDAHGSLTEHQLQIWALHREQLHEEHACKYLAAERERQSSYESLVEAAKKQWREGIQAFDADLSTLELHLGNRRSQDDAALFSSLETERQKLHSSIKEETMQGKTLRANLRLMQDNNQRYYGDILRRVSVALDRLPMPPHLRVHRQIHRTRVRGNDGDGSGDTTTDEVEENFEWEEAYYSNNSGSSSGRSDDNDSRRTHGIATERESRNFDNHMTRHHQHERLGESNGVDDTTRARGGSRSSISTTNLPPQFSRDYTDFYQALLLYKQQYELFSLSDVQARQLLQSHQTIKSSSST